MMYFLRFSEYDFRILVKMTLEVLYEDNFLELLKNVFEVLVPFEFSNGFVVMIFEV